MQNRTEHTLHKNNTFQKSFVFWNNWTGGAACVCFRTCIFNTDGSLPNIHEDYRSFFIASHLNLWVYAYANTYLMCIELNVSLQPPLYYKWSFVTSIERHVRRKTVMQWPNFPSCLIILITYASLAFISYIDEVPNFYRIRLSCVFYMLTCEVLLPT